MQAHRVHTGCVQVVRQLHRSLHLHVGLEDAAAEQCLFVGLPCLGLDSSLHPALGNVGGDGAAPAHVPAVARPVHHGVRLLRAPIQAPHTIRKPLLQGVQRVAAHGVEPPHLRCVQFLRHVHVIRLQVHVDGPYHAWDRVSDLGIGRLRVQKFRLDAHYMQT